MTDKLAKHLILIAFLFIFIFIYAHEFVHKLIFSFWNLNSTIVFSLNGIYTNLTDNITRYDVYNAVYLAHSIHESVTYAVAMICAYFTILNLIILLIILDEIKKS